MEEKPTFPKPLEAFFVIASGFVLIILIAPLALFILEPQPEELGKPSTIYKLILILAEIGIVIVPVIYIKKKNLSLKEIFRFNPIPTQIVSWSIILGISISIVGDELDRLVRWVFPAPDLLERFSDFLQINSGIELVILVIGAVIAASLVEEAVFRGFLQKSLEIHQDVTRGVIYASLAWAISHLSFILLMQFFLIGILFGLLVWRANSIYPAVIGHAINNIIALIYFNMHQEKLEKFYLWGDHVSPLILILALVGLYFGFRAFYRYYHRPTQNHFSVN
jgi:membrane protease YdiL (CAAX protease family)